MKKFCKCCGLKLDIKNFNKKVSSKDGFRYNCKKCNNYKLNLNRKRFLSKIKGIYYSQTINSKKRGHNPPEYSKEEFLNYCINSQIFQTLYKKWANSDFKKGLAPSIDRLDNSKGYSFENIQIVTWNQNRVKELKISNKTNSKKVDQYSIEGVFIKTYNSISEASRKTNTKNITKCLNGSRLTANNFIWKLNEGKKEE